MLSDNVVVIPCDQPLSKPTVITQLEYNDRPLEMDDRYHVLPSGHVQLQGVTSSDEGVYRCVAYNHILNRSVKSPYVYRLSVIEPSDHETITPTFTQETQKRVVVTQGSDLTLECAVQSWPPVEVSWEKYGGHLPTGRVEFLLGNLVIHKVQRFDAGTYICRPNVTTTNGHPPFHPLNHHIHTAPIPSRNHHSSGSRKQGFLEHSEFLESVSLVEVLEPPAIETWPTDHVVETGSTVTLKCKTRGIPKPLVTWYHDGRLIRRGQFVVVRDSTLTLSNANRKTNGVYQCFAQNTLASVHSSAYISVNQKNKNHNTNYNSNNDNNRNYDKERIKPITEVEPTDDYFDEDYEQDYYEEDYKQEDDDVISDDVTGMGSLSRRTQNVNDVIKDATEEGRWRANLPAPDKPLVSRIGESSILIKWKFQEEAHDNYHDNENNNLYDNNANNNNDNPYNNENNNNNHNTNNNSNKNKAILEAFVIQYKDILEVHSMWNDFDVDLDPHLRLFQVDNLRIGRAYKFRIVAVYGPHGNGVSPPSKEVYLDENPLLILRPTHLPTPTIVESRALSSSKIFVRWQVDDISDASSLVSGYHVFYAPYGKKFKRVTFSSNQIHHVVLSQLSRATNYNIRVQAFGAIGRESDSSEGVVQQTLSSDELNLYEIKHGDEVSVGNSYDAVSDVKGGGHMASNQLILVGVGLLLGVILLVVVACVVLLAWKQRKSSKQNGSPSELSRLHKKLFGNRKDCLEGSTGNDNHNSNIPNNNTPNHLISNNNHNNISNNSNNSNNILNNNNKQLDLLAFNSNNNNQLCTGQMSPSLLVTTTTTSSTNSTNSQQNNQTPLIVEQNYWLPKLQQQQQQQQKQHQQQLFYTGPSGIYSNVHNLNNTQINNNINNNNKNDQMRLTINTNNDNINYLSAHSPQSDYYSKVASSSDITAAIIKQQQQRQHTNPSNIMQRPSSQLFNNLKDVYLNDHNNRNSHNNLSNNKNNTTTTTNNITSFNNNNNNSYNTINNINNTNNNDFMMSSSFYYPSNLNQSDCNSLCTNVNSINTPIKHLNDLPPNIYTNNNYNNNNNNNTNNNNNLNNNNMNNDINRNNINKNNNNIYSNNLYNHDEYNKQYKTHGVSHIKNNSYNNNKNNTTNNNNNNITNNNNKNNNTNNNNVDFHAAESMLSPNYSSLIGPTTIQPFNNKLNNNNNNNTNNNNNNINNKNNIKMDNSNPDDDSIERFNDSEANIGNNGCRNNCMIKDNNNKIKLITTNNRNNSNNSTYNDSKYNDNKMFQATEHSTKQINQFSSPTNLRNAIHHTPQVAMEDRYNGNSEEEEEDDESYDNDFSDRGGDYGADTGILKTRQK